MYENSDVLCSRPSNRIAAIIWISRNELCSTKKIVYWRCSILEIVRSRPSPIQLVGLCMAMWHYSSGKTAWAPRSIKSLLLLPYLTHSLPFLYNYVFVLSYSCPTATTANTYQRLQMEGSHWLWPLNKNGCACYM